MSDEDPIQSIHKKIEREKALMTAANAMLAQTDNDSVRSRLNSQIRDGHRNLQFFEEKLRELQMRRVSSGIDNLSLSGPAGQASDDGSGPPPPPPKDAASWVPSSARSGSTASYGSAQYSQVGQHGDLMPPRHPYAPLAPGASVPKPRPNYSKLGA